MRVVVTGGLGLVGTSYAAHRLRQGDTVMVVDSAARGYSNALNGTWLEKVAAEHGSVFTVWIHDISGGIDIPAIWDGGVDWVLHAAAQSSVDRSMTDPWLDFESNVVGTVRLLEMLRLRAPKARMVFLASNKIYEVSRWPTVLEGTRYRFAGGVVGPSEAFPFHMDAVEPYGASKICGVHYCRCYAEMYEMPVVVAVPSGMYGPRQFGRSEQGWLGWFAIASQLGLPIRISGDGFQVRDMVHVDDVVRAIDMLMGMAEEWRGHLFNLGGGPSNAISLMDALGEIWRVLGRATSVEFGAWRPHDNKVYVSNIDKIRSFGWTPEIPISEGIADLCDWVRSSKADLEAVYRPTDSSVEALEGS